MSIGIAEFITGLFIFIVGSCIFSFFNVVVYRLPRQVSFVKERSACPACGHSLGAADMIPVAGWLLLRGRCRYCGAPISARYPLVECLGGFLALACFAKYGPTPACLTVFALLGILTMISLIDLDTMEIPDRLNLCILLLGILSAFTMDAPGWPERLLGFFCVSVPMFLVTLAVAGGFGGGDIKLMAAAGVFLGWKLTLFAAFFGVMSGGVYGSVLLLSGKVGRKDHFAFGPFLCAGIAAALFAGEEMIRWYLGFFSGY